MSNTVLTYAFIFANWRGNAFIYISFKSFITVSQIMTYILLYQFERVHISIALAYDDRSWTQAPEAQGRDREQDDRRTVQEEHSRTRVHVAAAVAATGCLKLATPFLLTLATFPFLNWTKFDRISA